MISAVERRSAPPRIVASPFVTVTSNPAGSSHRMPSSTSLRIVSTSSSSERR
jgi:hypothetical protein